MKVSDYVAAFLRAQGVEQVFELVGGMITHFIDAIHRDGHIALVSMHHEQAAAFAADAAGRLRGIPGVAMATSGPGATNLLTGIGSSFFDSSPAVFITGQVNRNEQRGGRPIRQLGFQETDIVRMASTITKAAYLIEEPQEVPARLAEAFSLALSGRQGPVLLDIPMDIQRAEICAPPPTQVTRSPVTSCDQATCREVLSALMEAERPLILVGGGLRAAQAVDDFRQFVQRARIPVVNSLLAVDALPYADSLRMGLIGSYGNRWANTAVARADCLLVLGSRLDIRQTGADTDAFKGNRIIFHVDCDSGEINNRVTGCVPIVADVREFLRTALQVSTDFVAPPRQAWLDEIMQSRAKWPDTWELRGVRGINPNAFMHTLSSASHHAAVYVADVGQHQMWAAQSLELTPSQRFITSGGMGAMGFGLPAAIGAAFMSGGRPITLIAGDGGFQVNVQELQTVARNSLPIKIVILNNGCHGMVRQFQQTYFEERYQSTYWGYSAPDFRRVALAYGLPARVVENPDDTDNALTWLWSEPNCPMLLEVKIDTFANAYPKLAFGLPITEMEPLASPLAMEGT